MHARQGPAPARRLTARAFGTLPSGEAVRAFTLSNDAGASAEVLTYGGIVRALRVPDRHGRMDDVVLGFERLAAYRAGHPYFGAIVGRIAGRVTGGLLSVDGRLVNLPCNEGKNHLHGGRRGLDKRLWGAAQVIRADSAASLRLTYTSPDGEEGYPGAVEIAVTYTLRASNELVVETEAAADRATPLSLTHHGYFNLAGEGSGPVTGHDVHVAAADYVPADATLTLSDRREPVWGSGADLTHPRRLKDALPGIAGAHGDLYLLRGVGEGPPHGPTLAARVTEETTGRVLEVHTDDACLQLYTGVGLDGTLVGKSGRSYGPHAGLCLECEGYPNASAVGGFGDIMVRPGQPQRRTTVYAFSAA
jgi:aldose 1-epimerase